MPKIPIHTAQGGRLDPPSSPDYIRGGLGPEDAMSSFGQNLSKLAQASAYTMGKLEQQQGENDYEIMRGIYEANVAGLMSRLDTDPSIMANPQSYMDEFQKGIRTFMPDVEKSSQNKIAQDLFKQHVTADLPKKLVMASARGQKLFAANEVQKLKHLKDQFSTEAVNAQSIEDSDRFVKRYYERVDSMVQAGLMYPAEGDLEKIEFDREVQTKAMDTLRVNDPQALIDEVKRGSFKLVPQTTQATIIAKANSALRDIEAKNDKLAKEWKKAEESRLYALVNFKKLTPEQEHALLEGTHPGFDAKEGRAIVAANRSDIGRESDEATLDIAYRFEQGSHTLERIRQFKQEAVNLAQSSGERNEKLGKFMKYLNDLERSLNSTERALDSQSRAQRAEQDRLTRQKVDRALTEYDSKYKSKLDNPIFKNKEIIEKKDIELRIWQGEDPKEVLADYERRKREREKPAPESPSEKMRELLKRRKP